MFVKKAKKTFPELTLSDVFTLIGLLQERQQSIYKEIGNREPNEDECSELAEYSDLEIKLWEYRDTFD